MQFRQFIVAAFLGLGFAAATSAELGASDAGVFVVLDRDRQPTSLSYRFTLDGGVWRAEGRDGQGSWKDISCDRGCEYVVATPTESEAYLSPAMRPRYTMACIQNMAQAFCKYVEKASPSQGGYVIMGLVTNPPTPIFVRRQR